MELGNLMMGNSRGNFTVNRDWQTQFHEFLDVCGFDNYGHIDDKELDIYKQEETSGNETDVWFENDVFIIRPYYWGDEEIFCVRPNFVFKPTGFELQWYKYPFRDSYMNQDISFNTLLDILKQCENSLVPERV